MQKIPTLFKRNDGNRQVYDEATFGTEWVFAGEGVPTRKFDGTCCRITNGKLWKRYTLRKGREEPGNFVPDIDCDDNADKCEGWVPVGDGPEDKWHRKACLQVTDALPDGTYELVGPKIQGNPEGFATHRLVPHGNETLHGVHPDFESLCAYLAEHNIEGIVWHHADGRMAKIKGRDFGIKRRPVEVVDGR